MLRSALSFYDAQQARSLDVVMASRGLWGKLAKPADFDRIIAQLFALITAGQLGAAKDAALYVPAALEEQARLAVANCPEYAIELSEDA